MNIKSIPYDSLRIGDEINIRFLKEKNYTSLECHITTGKITKITDKGVMYTSTTNDPPYSNKSFLLKRHIEGELFWKVYTVVIRYAL